MAGGYLKITNSEAQPHVLIRQWLSVALPTQVYHYTRLDPTTRDIRLLVILPSKEESTQLECLLTQVSLDDDPHYEALSYAWGSQNEDIGTVSLEGKPFPVTPNLEDALRNLRLEEKPRALWVDALSINQIDDEEKSHQVQQMYSIYHLATRVVIWLGRESDDSDLAMDLIADIHKMGADNFRPSLENARSWEALTKFYRRPWFSRVWVLQETAVSNLSPEVRAGKKVLLWDACESAQRFVEIQVKNSNDPVSAMARNALKATVAAIHNVRRDLSPTDPMSSLEMLLKRTMTFHATDPRDKVFALLGLAHESDRVEIDPDYSKSLEQVYAEIAVYLISRNINMIYFNTNSPNQNHPSWVPDWSWLNRRWPLWTPGFYKAAGSTTQAGRFSEDLSTFTVPALLIDRVNVTDEFVPRGANPIEYNESHMSLIIGNIESLLRKAIDESSFNAELAKLSPEKSNALWRTLVTNKEHITLTCPAPDTYGDMFNVSRGQSKVPAEFHPDLPTEEERKQRFVRPYEENVQWTMSDQRFFITRNGRIGVGPRHLQETDLIVVFWGADMPCVLREKGGGHAQFLGPVYVHGVMDGEAFKHIETKAALEAQSELFLLR
ncbi:hypothetical protein MMC07_003042 [Pseudocyphellaria aurata]|nr:hypothetical protein [Pseudocyphellaria aurata]